MSDNAGRDRDRAVNVAKKKLIAAIGLDSKFQCCLMIVDKKGQVFHLGTPLFDGFRHNPGPRGMMRLLEGLPMRRPSLGSASFTSFQNAFSSIK
jgi:hypothetical protein